MDQVLTGANDGTNAAPSRQSWTCPRARRRARSCEGSSMRRFAPSLLRALRRRIDFDTSTPGRSSTNRIGPSTPDAIVVFRSATSSETSYCTPRGCSLSSRRLPWSSPRGTSRSPSGSRTVPYRASAPSGIGCRGSHGEGVTGAGGSVYVAPDSPAGVGRRRRRSRRRPSRRHRAVPRSSVSSAARRAVRRVTARKAARFSGPSTTTVRSDAPPARDDSSAQGQSAFGAPQNPCSNARRRRTPIRISCFIASGGTDSIGSGHLTPRRSNARWARSVRDADVESHPRSPWDGANPRARPGSRRATTCTRKRSLFVDVASGENVSRSERRRRVRNSLPIRSHFRVAPRRATSR